jgi:hypothetical protein
MMASFQKIIRGEGLDSRKISPLYWLSVLKKHVTVPAVEEDVPGSGERAG